MSNEVELHEHACCEHEHEHDHEHGCGCEHHHEHEHEHGHGCEHHHEHEHEHEHGHEHGCGCGCGHDHEGGEEGFPWKLIVAAVLFLSGVIVTKWLLPTLPAWVAGVWMGAAAVLPLWPVLREAAEELRDRSLGENVLLVIAVVAAFAIGEWYEGTLVLLLFSLGELLEDKAMDYSRDKISSLAAVTPDSAVRLTADGEETVPAEQVVVGDRLRVPPHTRVPADCVVLEGDSAVDASAITGESAPVSVTAGSRLMSGMLNGSGMLTVQVEHPASESAAARILQLVEDSVARKGQSEKFITRFARIYTPAVTAAAVLVAVVPPLFGGGWTDWLYRALVFLVASCPCALVISIPLSFYAGIAAAARHGVLLKGGCFVETLAKVQAFAFDKTGTLTTGELRLAGTVTAAGVDEAQALSLAAALEQHSAHPVAHAICAAVAGGECALEEVAELPGIGVKAQWQGHTVACGGLRLLQQAGIAPESLPAGMAEASAYLVQDGQVLAAFLTDFRLQEGAAELKEQLGKLGITRLEMLTGDRAAQAQAVAKAVGLTDAVHAELLPEDKLAEVKALQAEGLTTAFVGDGINDAPVLAAADVGIAMGLGSPAAIETADVVLVSGGLSRLAGAVRLCQRTVSTVHANIIFALGVKAAVLLLGVFGIAPMWLAVFADMGVTLIAVANSLRLLRA